MEEDDFECLQFRNGKLAAIDFWIEFAIISDCSNWNLILMILAFESNCLIVQMDVN